MSDAAEVLFAVAAVLTALALGLFVAQRRTGRARWAHGDSSFELETVLERIEVAATTAAREATSASRQVNGVPADSPTLVARVTELETSAASIRAHARWQTHAIRCIADHVGCPLSQSPAGTQPADD